MDSTRQPTTFALELRPRIPEALARLNDLASNLMYSWDRRIRGLFWRLDAGLWTACSNNPRVFLRRVAQEKLDAAAQDPDFLYEYHGALAAFDIYRATRPTDSVRSLLEPGHDLVAYFCAEYGLHESLPIYSGGLGILAGDHCKSASDLRVPLVAVGLLYREGYFTQRIDGHGQQQALHLPVSIDDLPVQMLRRDDGSELRVTVDIARRAVSLRIWQADVGQVRLFLLDADVAENSEEDRAITYQLYGGGLQMRIQQEIVLGIGGVRALRALGLAPTAWHLNEGHAAFSNVERIRELKAAGFEFDAAVEHIAQSTVFTTHTPVPAGHDRFPHEMLREYLGRQLDELGSADTDALLRLGHDEHPEPLFNMTALAMRCARFINGVSKIHGHVAAQAERYIWPDLEPDENPLTSITNGIHLHTFLGRMWTRLFHSEFPEWTKHLSDSAYWQAIDQIPHHPFVAMRQRAKRDMLKETELRIREQHRRNGTPEALVSRITQIVANPGSKALVVGFARRFATYKRATLLLRDRDRLLRILGNAQRPVLFVFAGKAHPRDEPGQALIRELYAASMTPELIGKLIVVEGYDMHFARNLVQGCDVWLNNPEYPMEACGTSGMKAGVNGVINLSVLDGWWGEAWDGSNGYAIKPVSAALDHEARAREEAAQLMDLLEHEVIPRYFGADNTGWSESWIALCRQSMKTIIPRFNGERMVMDYVRRAYAPASRRSHALAAAQGEPARDLATFKRRIAAHWDAVRLQLEAPLPCSLDAGETLHLQVRVELGGLQAEDVALECVQGNQHPFDGFEPLIATRFDIVRSADGIAHYSLQLTPMAGLQHLRIRAYPFHPGCVHPFDTGRMHWL